MLYARFQCIPDRPVPHPHPVHLEITGTYHSKLGRIISYGTGYQLLVPIAVYFISLVRRRDFWVDTPCESIQWSGLWVTI